VKEEDDDEIIKLLLEDRIRFLLDGGLQVILSLSVLPKSGCIRAGSTESSNLLAGFYVKFFVSIPLGFLQMLA
jgi:hypothetical protein